MDLMFHVIPSPWLGLSTSSCWWIGRKGTPSSVGGLGKIVVHRAEQDTRNPYVLDAEVQQGRAFMCFCSCSCGTMQGRVMRMTAVYGDEVCTQAVYSGKFGQSSGELEYAGASSKCWASAAIGGCEKV